MGHYIIYNEEGRILRSIYCSDPSTIEIQIQDGEQYAETDGTVDETKFYYDDGLKPRPEFDITIDDLTFYGVPENTKITIEGVEYIADGTDIEMSFTLSGRHFVSFDLFPYQSRTLEVIIP